MKIFSFSIFEFSRFGKFNIKKNICDKSYSMLFNQKKIESKIWKKYVF